jgi:hypothetical protein
MAMLIGMLSFSLAAWGISWAVGKRARTAEMGETSLSVLLAVWAALFFGIYLTRL